MNQGKQRIAWLDMAKGYGMILVIFAHLEVGLIGKWIYTFHMPLFFFLSGYVFSDKKDFRSFFMSKCKSMLLPYVCLGIPMLAYETLANAFAGYFSMRNFIVLIKQWLIQERLWTIWFLACLFFLNLFFYGAKKFLETDLKMAILAIVLVFMGLAYYKIGGRALPWNIDVCSMAYPFFFAGYFCKEKQAEMDRYLNSKIWSLLLLIGAGVVNLVCGYFSVKISGNGLEMYASTYGFAPLTYLSALAGILCVIVVSRWKTIKPIQYIGQNSLLYFAWHQTIMMPISEALLSLVHFTVYAGSSLVTVYLYKIIQLLIILLALTICNEMISGTRLRFMLGKI